VRALEAIERGEKLVQTTTKPLAEQGYVNVAEVTQFESLEPEYRAVAITEKGELLLKGQKENEFSVKTIGRFCRAVTFRDNRADQ
jgi:hypothetical protein